LNIGHYVAIAKNFKNNQWYLYDDQKVTMIAESSIQKNFAYILFYVRKDVQEKKLADFFPHIQNDFFPGKPVQASNGNDAFVVKS